MKTEIMVITPEIASKFLLMRDDNHKNRKIDKRAVSTLARDMAAGRWRLTHQGIAFDSDGFLRDGQHRLNAVVESGCSVPMMVTFGLQNSSYEGIDIGRKRDTKDIFALSDNYKDDVLLKNPSVLSMVRNLYKLGVNTGIELSNGEILEFVSQFRREVNDVYHISITRKGHVSVTAQISAACLAGILCGESVDDVSAFFDCFARADTSTSFGKNVQAPLLWAGRILSAKAKRLKMSARDVYLGTQNALWNFCRNTDSSCVAKIPKSERYPVEKIISHITSRCE